MRFFSYFHLKQICFLCFFHESTAAPQSSIKNKSLGEKQFCHDDKKKVSWLYNRQQNALILSSISILIHKLSSFMWRFLPKSYKIGNDPCYSCLVCHWIHFFPVALMRHRAMTHFTFQCHFSLTLATALTLTEDSLGKSNKSSSQSLKQNRSVPINW